MNRILQFAFMSSFLFLSSALAKTALPGEDPFLDQLTLFVGGGEAGYSHISASPSDELNKNGYQLGLKGSVAYSWEKITAGFGAGWLFNDSEGTSTNIALTKDRVKTKAAFMDLTGRYRFTPRWEVGPIGRLQLGTDTRYSTTGESDNGINLLGGLEGVYRIPLRFPIQFSLSFLTDATIKNRQVFQFLGGIQIGWPFQWNRSSNGLTSAKASIETSKVEIPKEERITVLELKNVEFDFDSADVKGRSKKMLEELGSFLSQKSKEWKSLNLEGHTDNRGSYEYNLSLSQKRAETVREILVTQSPSEKAKIEEPKVKTEAYSFSRPLIKENNEMAWQRNRRVEFRFKGIEDAKEFAEFFENLNKKFSTRKE